VFKPSEFRELVSGQRRGGRAAALRGVLRAAELPYSLAVGWRNRRYDLGHNVAHRVRIPVISVGNLTLGGTGKTPMVKWLARWLRDRGLRVAIVSRGYGAGGSNHNDEALELRQSLPDVPHVQDPDRVAGASRAIAEFGCDALLLDDGFQHRRLARDLDIVLLDALEPFGYDHVFPRGTLREPMSGLQRAHVACLSRADTISDSERSAIRRRVLDISPRVTWCECVHAANTLTNSAGRKELLSVLAGRRVAAFCGIGNPAGFRHTLAQSGCQIAGWCEFPDHHAFGANDIAELSRVAAGCRADFLVCTQKDLVKLQREVIDGRPLWAVAIEMQFTTGRLAIEQVLEACIAKRMRDEG
jgi:tetraacyldisaccharide 4'-kinase